MLRISWSTIFVCTNFQIRIYWHPSLEFTNLSQLQWMYLCINQKYLVKVILISHKPKSKLDLHLIGPSPDLQRGLIQDHQVQWSTQNSPTSLSSPYPRAVVTEYPYFFSFLSPAPLFQKARAMSRNVIWSDEVKEASVGQTPCFELKTWQDLRHRLQGGYNLSFHLGIIIND